MSSRWIDIAGRHGAILSAVEVGLGSILHSFRIPFSGQFLSLNQGFILTRACLKARGSHRARTVGLYVANVAAILKSLSPAGKKLTPMLAISAQGFLYTLGTGIFGVNPVGVCLGMAFLSVWAFVQPILIYYLLYGKTLLHVADYFFEKLSRTFEFSPGQLAWILGSFIIIKIFLAVLVGVAAFYLPEPSVIRYQRTLLNAGRKKRKKLSTQAPPAPLTQKAWLALRDLFNPLFILSLSLTAFFFIFAHNDTAQLFWALLRPIAVGFLLFFLIRTVPFDWLYQKLERGGLRGFGLSLRAAIQTLQKL